MGSRNNPASNVGVYKKIIKKKNARTKHCVIVLTFSENRYIVLDYATRNMTQVDEPQDSEINVAHMFSLVLLENSDSKTKEFLMAGITE